jgi:hypothetical protein
VVIKNGKERDKDPRRRMGKLPDYSALENHRVAEFLL